MMTKPSLLPRALVSPELIFHLLNKYKNKQMPFEIDSTDLDAIAKELETFWQNANNTLAEVMNRNKQNYNLNMGINIAIITLGIALLIVSVVEGVIRGVGEFAAITSAIGVADFVSIFLVNPQTSLRKANADIAEMEIIFDGWFNETLTAFYRLVSNGFANNEIELFQASLSKYTNEAVTFIENTIGT